MVEQLPNRDRVWLRHAFLLPTNGDMVKYGSGVRRRYATSAAFKFTNTSLGGNFAINNPPQFTRNADIRQPGRGRTEHDRHKGMGRYYSEAIDDTKQVVHMSFGVPEYSSWTSFFTNFYDSHAAQLANTGKVSKTWYTGGWAFGFIVSLPLQPFILGLSAVSRVHSFLTNTKPSKWYYFKPTMHNYWSSVNTIANEMAIGIGLIPRPLPIGQKALEDPGQKVTPEDMKRFHEAFPDVFREGGGIDVMSLATRSQRMADASQLAYERVKENHTNAAVVRAKIEEYVNSKVTDPNPDLTAQKYFDEYLTADPPPDDGIGTTESISDWKGISTSGVYSFMRAHQRDGSQFASFRVHHKGTVSESFSNSTRESDIAQSLNAKVTAGRNASMTYMGGEVTEFIGAAKDAVASWIGGALDSVNMGGLATLAGTAFVDIPKVWENSSAQLPRADYTVPLISPYGNKMSRLINLYVPISMLLAAVLPRSAGRSAYTSPYLCQIYHQGRVQCQLGMIDSLTITRGTGNVGWNAEHDMLGCEVTFSVIDLSSVLHMPIKAGFASPNALTTMAKGGAVALAEAAGGDTAAAATLAVLDAGVWDEQSLFSDYMSVLTSMPLSDTYYAGNRLNINMARSLESFKKWRSPSNMVSWAMDSAPARALAGFSQFSDRL